MCIKMADYSPVVECLSKFQTHNIDAAWLKATWDGDHSQLDILPVDFETLHQDTDWTSVLRATSREVRHYIASQNAMAGKDKMHSAQANGTISSEEERPRDSSDGENEEEGASSFWVALVENGISCKGVVIVTGCLIERGSSRTSQFSQSDIALQAACLYLCLICIPGSSAFRLFHPVLYQKAIDLLTLAKRFNNASIGTGIASRSGGKRKRTPTKTAVQRKSRAAAGKNVGGGDQEERFASEDDDSVQDRSVEPEDESFTVRQMKSLLDSMHQLLLDLNLFLKAFTLKHDAQSLEHTILRLSELLNFEGKSQAVELASLSKDNLACLMSLCLPFHGSVKVTVTTVMKRMFNMLLHNATHGIINCICQLVTDIPGDKALPGARILIQNMCMKAPERADARLKVSSVILVLIDNLPPHAFFGIVEWFLRFMQSSKVNSRVFALEIVALILGRKPSERPLAHFPPGRMRDLSCQCLHAVLARCSDVAATVRSKALAILANCVTTENSLAYGAMLEIFAPEKASHYRTSANPSTDDAPQPVSDKELTNSGVSSLTSNQVRMPNLESPILSVNSTLTSNSDTSPTQPGESKSPEEESAAVGTESGNCLLQSTNLSRTLPTLHLVMELLRDRVSDKKVYVRKAAIQVLQRAMELNPECLSLANVQTLQERCLDTSILVKKQSMQALTAVLLSYPTREDLQQAWMHGILPSIVDPENSIQEKCVEMVDDVLLQNIVVFSQSTSPTNAMAWIIMNEIAHNEGHLIKAWRFIQRAFFFMARSGKLRKNVVQILQSHINTENDDATWLLLSGLAQCIDIKNSNFVFTYWDTHQHEIDKCSTTLTNVLKVMAAACKHSDETTVTKYFTRLSALLEELSCSYKIIATLVETIVKLSEVNKSNKATSMLLNVCGSVFKKCDKYLASVFLNEANDVKTLDEDSVIKHLTAMAEVVMVYPKLSSERIFIILKSIMVFKCTTPQAAENVVLGSQETQSTQRIVKFSIGALSQRMQNFALVALGKLCLQNETLAKDCTPALGRLLETSSDPVAINNIVVILVDLCVRYTTMVDPYFPSVTACLKDPSFMVRNQTLTLLTHLLQDDYIKWRGSLFFCFVTALVDPSPAIRTFTEHAILHILTKRHPAMLFQHFVECLFFFNAYQDHEGYNNIIQSEKEAKLFSLAGDKNVEKRMTLYKFMLANMADEHRFQVTAKLCQDILGGAVNNMIKLKRPNGTICINGQNLVRDTLAILSCDEIKLATLRNTPQDELEDADTAAAALATVKKTVVSQVVKKSVIENIVPILISLKHKLEKLHSSLLKDLMFYLKELVKGDYKVEVKEVLATDKQLSAELEYDLKKFEQEQAAITRMSVVDGRKNLASPVVELQNDVHDTLHTLTPNPPVQTEKMGAGPVLQSADAPRQTLSNRPCTRQSLSNATDGKPASAPEPIASNGSNHSKIKLDISMLPVVQLEKLDCSILENGSISVANDSKATLYDVRMAETIINSPALPRNPRRQLLNTSRTSVASKSQVLCTATADKSSTTETLHGIPILPIQSLERQEKPVSVDHMSAVLSTSKTTNIPLPATFTPKAEPISPGRATGGGVPNTPVKPVLERDLLRAISTPCGVITDITFRLATGNLSPIVNQFPQDMLLHVMTPERASTQPQQWGVVPLAKRTLLTTVPEGDEMNTSK